MNIKLKIITTLLGVFFGCGIVTSQTPKAEQAMDSKRQHITEVAALTGKGDLDKLKIVLIDGLNDGIFWKWRRRSTHRKRSQIQETAYWTSF